jgi:nucleoside-diphosphate-sugar epimerase
MTTIGITSVGSGIGQAVLRALAGAEIAPRTVGMDISAANSGIHWVDVPILIPPTQATDDHRRAVFAAVADHRIDILIPGNDNELAQLAAWRDELAERGCTTIVSSPEAVQVTRDKLVMAQWCHDLRLPFAPTWTLTEAHRRVAEFDYPLIAKPRSGSASDGISLIADAAALVALPGGDDVIVQHYLPPVSRELQVDPTARLEQRHEVSAQYLLSGEGRILGSFVSMNRLKAGIPVEVVPVDDEPWADDGRAIVEALAGIGAVGPVNLQGRLTTDGRVIFFEANLRFTGITGIRSMMGYREVSAAISSLVDGDDKSATALLRRAPGLMGLRHVGDAVVSTQRVAELTRASTSTVESTAAPTTVVVTGATGYLGRAVVAALLEADVERVHVLARPGADLTGWPDDRVVPIVGDLLDDELHFPGADALLHLAAVRADARGSRIPGLFEANVEGTVRAARAARAAGIGRLVFASSQAVYGTARPPLWSESLPVRPESDYAITKALGEAALRGIADLEVVALRLARLYGAAPGMRWTELPHQFALRATRSLPLEIDGGGDQRIDLVHVADAAAAVLAAAAAPAPRGFTALNVGGGAPISVRRLAEVVSSAVIQAGGRPVDIRYRGGADVVRPDFGMHLRRARAHLGWSPLTPVDRAIDELIAKAGVLD